MSVTKQRSRARSLGCPTVTVRLPLHPFFLPSRALRKLLVPGYTHRKCLGADNDGEKAPAKKGIPPLMGILGAICLAICFGLPAIRFCCPGKKVHADLNAIP